MSFEKYMPVLGKIKVGEIGTSKSGKEYPTTLDYFRATAPNDSLVEMFHGVLGAEPKKLTILFPADDPEYFCIERFEGRDKAGKLMATGDGECYYKYRYDNGDFSTETLTRAEVLQDGDLKGLVWKKALIMRFVVLELGQALGLWQLTTNADKSSIPNLKRAYDSLLNMRGSVAGIPFELSVHKHKSNTPGANHSYPVLNMHAVAPSVKMDLMRGYLELTAPTQATLPPPNIELESVMIYPGPPAEDEDIGFNIDNDFDDFSEDNSNYADDDIPF